MDSVHVQAGDMEVAASIEFAAVALEMLPGATVAKASGAVLSDPVAEARGRGRGPGRYQTKIHNNNTLYTAREHIKAMAIYKGMQQECMYVFMYVCMYVCMYGWMDVGM